MFSALLDTNVLWPSLQRDFLLSLAAEGLYRPLWSEAILEEVQQHGALKLMGRGIPVNEARGRVVHLIGQMRLAFDDAIVVGWENLEGAFGLPDRDDEHVLAAATIGGAGVIVTENDKDFPVAATGASSRARERASVDSTSVPRTHRLPSAVVLA
jgi:predicted nucleic acid-binding protein